MSFQRDIGSASASKLISALHDFLDERGFIHEYEPLKAGHDSIDDMTVFKHELLGKRDSPRRDRAYLFLGIVLLPTILFTTLGISFISQSRYTLRTLVSISVEGKPYLAEDNEQGPVQGEVPDSGKAARITVALRAGTAKDDMDIWKPADTRREVVRLAEERRRLEEGLSGLLLGID